MGIGVRSRHYTFLKVVVSRHSSIGVSGGFSLSLLPLVPCSIGGQWSLVASLRFDNHQHYPALQALKPAGKWGILANSGARGNRKMGGWKILGKSHAKARRGGWEGMRDET